MKPLISIIIPTFNNPADLEHCVRSIMTTGVLNMQMAELIIVNNGDEPIKERYGKLTGIRVINTGDNLGWEGGLKAGVAASDSPFIVFQNDDTLIPRISYAIYQGLMQSFNDKKVAAVGPSSTTVSGVQSVYNTASCLPMPGMVRWMIFFCVMVRRSALEEVGGVDTTLPGGDDIDLCMRFRKAGYKCIVNPDLFLIHHGFHTGNRVYGDGYAGVAGGWNSPEMSERTNQSLIKKHGFKAFMETMSSQVIEYMPTDGVDKEGDIVTSFIKPDDKVVELGCGFRRTISWATTVDVIPKGEMVPLVLYGNPKPSVADVVADVSKELPFDPNSFDVVLARHVLEHCVDTVETLKHWIEVLKIGGKLIIALPNQNIINSIPLAIDHVHAFTPDSLKEICELLGLKQTSSQSCDNGISFLSVFEKLPVPEMKQSFNLDRLYEGDCTTIPFQPQLVRA